MILVIAFNNFEHKEVRVLNTELISQKNKELLATTFNESKNNSTLMMEKYEYNAFYHALKKGFIKNPFPLTVENMLFVQEYNADEHLMNSW